MHSIKSGNTAALLVLAVLTLVGCASPNALPPAATQAVSQDQTHATAASPTIAATPTSSPMPPTRVSVDQPTAKPSTVDLSTNSHAAAVQPGTPTTLDQALHEGYVERAITLWEADPPDLAGQGVVALDVAHAYLAEERPHDAIAMLVQLVQVSDAPDIRAAALGLLGSIYADLGEWQASIEAYRQHLELTQAAAPHVQIRMAKAYGAQGDRQNALTALQSIDLEALSTAERAGVLEDMAELQREEQAYDTALWLYNQILSFAEQSGYRALVQHYQAQTLVEADRLDEALSVWGSILTDMPESYSAILAMDALDMHDAAELADLDRARILIKAKRYDNAEDTLQRHIYTHTDASLAQAYLLLGDVYAAQDAYGAAFDAYDTVIREYPDSALIGDAWLAKASAEVAYGGDPSGLYFEFARLYPHPDDAGEALWLGGQYLERAQAWERAAEFYQLLVERFEESNHAHEGTFRLGLMFYASDQAAEALEIWQQGDNTDESAEEQARWFLWQGLAANKLGQDPRPAWRDAYKAGPTTYYGLRAQELAGEIDGDNRPTQVLSLPHIGMTQQAWREIDAWISTWHTATLSQEIAAEIDEATATALLLDRMGEHAQAMNEIRTEYDAHQSDPRALIHLADQCLQQDWYSPMILAANRVRWLGQQEEAIEAPYSLWMLSYPIVYPELVQAYAAQYGLDPLLMLALMRQESRFDAQAVSYANAKGLAQVMPDTGAWIAERLTEGGFRTSWLERPHISISYGAWFLRWLFDLYENDVVASLVAYNAGPGNVNRWTNEQPIADHDLFIETLPLQQPYDYVTWISVQHSIYQWLYAGE